MGLIDITNNENIYGSVSNWLDWMKPIGAVIVGFLLNFIPTWLRNRRERKRIADTFTNELLLIKSSMKIQLELIEIYLVAAKKEDVSPDNKMYLKLIHGFDFILTLDRIRLIEYFEKKYKKRSTFYISMIYQNLALANSESERLKEESGTYAVTVSELLSKYGNQISDFKHSILTFYEEVGLETSNQDELLNKISAITSNTKIGFKSTFHSDLKVASLKFKGHKLHKVIHDFDMECERITDDLGRCHRKQVATVDLYQSTLTSIYKFIYETDFNEVKIFESLHSKEHI